MLWDNPGVLNWSSLRMNFKRNPHTHTQLKVRDTEDKLMNVITMKWEWTESLRWIREEMQGVEGQTKKIQHVHNWYF